MAEEGDLEEYFRKEVKRRGGQRRRVKWIGVNGAPDDVVWWPKAPALAELKARGKPPKPHQAREHERLRTAFDVYVIDSKEAVDALIDKLIALSAERCRE